MGLAGRSGCEDMSAAQQQGVSTPLNELHSPQAQGCECQPVTGDFVGAVRHDLIAAERLDELTFDGNWAGALLARVFTGASQ